MSKILKSFDRQSNLISIDSFTILWLKFEMTNESYFEINYVLANSFLFLFLAHMTLPSNKTHLNHCYPDDACQECNRYISTRFSINTLFGTLVFLVKCVLWTYLLILTFTHSISLFSTERDKMPRWVGSHGIGTLVSLLVLKSRIS